MLSKTITLRRILVLGALAALAWSAAASQGRAGGATAITQCGQTVRQNAYLTQDLHCPGSNGVVVGAPGITIDLKGHVLRGTVRASTASGNGRIGIYVEGASATVRSSTATGNGGVGIGVTGDAATIKANRAEGNGFEGAASDLDGLGIHASDYTTAPVGTNVARGNDDPDECEPAPLC